IDENGWCVLNASQKEPINHFAHHGKTDWKPINGRVCWRPKSLKGIETNNGWIKIESEADLPKSEKLGDAKLCFIKSDEYNEIGVGNFSFGTFKTLYGNDYSNITHYQPITKPEPPI